MSQPLPFSNATLVAQKSTFPGLPSHPTIGLNPIEPRPSEGSGSFLRAGAGMRQTSSSSRRLDAYISRALNTIRKPSTVEEITELLNRELDSGDRPFETTEVAAWLQSSQN